MNQKPQIIVEAPIIISGMCYYSRRVRIHNAIFLVLQPCSNLPGFLARFETVVAVCDNLR